MAINPATGHEDPNYEAPTESIPGVDEEPTNPIPNYEPTDFDKGAVTGQDETGEDTYENTDPTTIEDGNTFVSPESTVAGQLESIFKKDSPLQKLAVTRAKENASALGMQSSSAGIGANMRAMYDSAMPIAQQDAKTYADAKGREQSALIAQSQVDKEAQVAGDLKVQAAGIAERQQKLNDDFNVTLSNMQHEDAKEITAIKNDFQEAINTSNNNLQETLAELAIDADVEKTIMNQSHDLLNNVQISWQQMLTNDNFLNNFTTREDMLASMNNLLKPVQASLVMSAQQAGVYDADFQTWVGTMIDSAAYR